MAIKVRIKAEKAAPVVERLAYAPRRPPDAQLAAIDAELAGLGVPG